MPPASLSVRHCAPQQTRLLPQHRSPLSRAFHLLRLLPSLTLLPAAQAAPRANRQGDRLGRDRKAMRRPGRRAEPALSAVTSDAVIGSFPDSTAELR